MKYRVLKVSDENGYEYYLAQAKPWFSFWYKSLGGKTMAAAWEITRHENKLSAEESCLRYVRSKKVSKKAVIKGNE